MSASRKISVVGLGYVGLPVAVAFGRSQKVIGFDIDPGRISELSAGSDRTGEVSSADLAAAEVVYTSDPSKLKEADFHIVAVPTPVDRANVPDMGLVLRASETVGKQLKRGDIVVYESTVYPGATEDECVPALERASGLRCGEDFTVGYSPERINPGDKEHSFQSIRKVVSGQDARTLEIVASVYGSVVKAGVFKAASIKTAEAAKIIENTQRDINIALMNECSLIFSRIGIDMGDVLAAAGTKWNFLNFRPGLVGGHCIGVDPYYLTHKAASLGYSPQVILAGRRINDSMGESIAREVVRELCIQGRQIRNSIVTVLGLTFKENVPDIRNTKVVDIVRELDRHGIRVQVHDPACDPHEAMEEYNLPVCTSENLLPSDAVVLAVPHAQYVSAGWAGVTRILREQKGPVFDVKGVLPRESIPDGVVLKRL